MQTDLTDRCSRWRDSNMWEWEPQNNKLARNHSGLFSFLYLCLLISSLLRPPACDHEIYLWTPSWRTPQFLKRISRTESWGERRFAREFTGEDVQVYSLQKCFQHLWHKRGVIHSDTNQGGHHKCFFYIQDAVQITFLDDVSPWYYWCHMQI